MARSREAVCRGVPGLRLMVLVAIGVGGPGERQGWWTHSQSDPKKHWRPTAHEGQLEPPQSTSVSSPSTSPFKHELQGSMRGSQGGVKDLAAVGHQAEKGVGAMGRQSTRGEQRNDRRSFEKRFISRMKRVAGARKKRAWWVGRVARGRVVGRYGRLGGQLGGT